MKHHDVNKINTLLKLLRDKGNTVLIVEHDPDVIKIADHVVDMGPRAGRNGGKIMYQGDFNGLVHSGTTTGKYLCTQTQLKKNVRNSNGWLSLKDANLHNLKILAYLSQKGL